MFLSKLNATEFEVMFVRIQTSINLKTLLFSERIRRAKNPFTEEVDKRNKNMENVSINNKTGFLYCPRCGLRKPKAEILGYYGGYCPACGCRMIEEMYLPYTSKKPKHTVMSPPCMNYFMRY